MNREFLLTQSSLYPAQKTCMADAKAGSEPAKSAQSTADSRTSSHQPNSIGIEQACPAADGTRTSSRPEDWGEKASGNNLISGRSVRKKCDDISAMTLWRWRNDKMLSFPKPIVIQGRIFFVVSEIESWIEARKAERDQAKVA